MDDQNESAEDLAPRLAQIEKLIDEYETKIHISKIKLIEPDLDITKEVLESMHWEDLHLLSWEYAQYTLALQKEINKHQSRYNWADTNLKRFLEREAPNYAGFKWEERQANALAENEYAQRLDKLKIQSKLAIDRLAFLPSKIDFLTKIIQDIAKSKRYSHVDKE